LPELDQDLNSKRAGGSEWEARQRVGATANSTKTAGFQNNGKTGLLISLLRPFNGRVKVKPF